MPEEIDRKQRMLAASPDQDTCRACGACCAYSRDWPRFGLETQAQIEAIPREYVDDARGTMRCEGERCIALQGEVGVATMCTLYAVRPQVCRDCLPGDDSCLTARARYNLPPVSAALASAAAFTPVR